MYRNHIKIYNKLFGERKRHFLIISLVSGLHLDLGLAGEIPDAPEAADSEPEAADSEPEAADSEP